MKIGNRSSRDNRLGKWEPAEPSWMGNFVRSSSSSFFFPRRQKEKLDFFIWTLLFVSIECRWMYRRACTIKREKEESGSRPRPAWWKHWKAVNKRQAKLYGTTTRVVHVRAKRQLVKVRWVAIISTSRSRIKIEKKKKLWPTGKRRISCNMTRLSRVKREKEKR